MKFRALLVALALGGLGYLCAQAAQEPDRPKSGDNSGKLKEELTLREQILQRQFDDFMQAMLKLKQRLERSDKAEDKEKAKILERAIAQAQDASISTKFDQLVSFLKKEQFSKVDDIQKAKDQAVDLARNLKLLLDTLREDTRANKLREERERLERIIKMLEKVIHEQKVMQTRTEMPRSDPKSLQRDQNKVTQATKTIAQELGKISQGGEAKDTKGEAKEGKGADKSGQGKDAGKDNESKKAQSKEAGKGDGSKASEAKGNESKSGQGEGKQGEAKSGQGKDGGAKDSKSGSESKAGGSKGNEGKPGKDGEAKDEGKKEPGIREKNKAEAKGDQGKEGANAAKQAESKSGGQKAPESGGSKSAQSGSESKSGDSKSGGSESKQGEAKPGQSSSGQSSSKSSGKEAGGSKGDPNQKQQDQPQGPDIGKKQVEDANYKQNQAEANLEKKETKPASDNMEEAIKKLEEARKKLEKLLQQTREEELERLLAALQARCEKMLAMQIAVLHGTQALDKNILKSEDKKPAHADKQRGLRLSDDEKEIVLEADKAIQMLEAEGSAVAFPEVFQQVREDMRHVQRRLYVTDAGVVTQAIEQDIIDTLKEMIEALKKARQELDAKKSPPPGQPPPNADQKLLDQIAELKMIRAMQMRVNTRTKTYGQQYQGEQAAEPRIRQELRNLSDRQVRIFEVTNKIAKGDNR